MIEKRNIVVSSENSKTADFDAEMPKSPGDGSFIDKAAEETIKILTESHKPKEIKFNV